MPGELVQRDQVNQTYLDEGDYVAAAGEAAGELYGYGKSAVIFKPTKATAHPFRPAAEEAMSYFVGGAAIMYVMPLLEISWRRSPRRSLARQKTAREACARSPWPFSTTASS